MSQILETYRLELKVKGPVFVGSGYEIQKKEYAFFDRSTIGVVDAEKLYLMAKKKRLTPDLERFMVEDTREDLKHWARRNRVSDKELEGCMKYMVNAGDLQMEKGRMQIMACMADPYGNPYIPGSSVKGMLRTVLLCNDILRNPDKYASDARNMKRDLQELRMSRTKVLAKNISEVEAKAFRTLQRNEKKPTDAVNDIMAGVIVSDSEPLSREDMILCQKWEQHVDGTYKTLNLLRECVKPGTVIRCTLTIDKTICKWTMEEILDAVKAVYEQYYKVFQRKFARMDRAAENTVFLGGGSGFVSKTMIYSLFGERDGVEMTKNIFEKTNVPKEHKHYLDTRTGVSPHILKCTRYQGKEYMMGQCELSLTEI